ncbi:hypothetical protein SAMN05421670_3023 [Psychrobacillus psychrotolerans]|uniref:Uncharacterized protein n=1 Tax=Psychrobacillus psychrotolerans TaxID=126156 RepID=A0A1I6A0B6_9BACI|nr:hypothetical protein [Psychrobacillus psychrotolerans]SFQ62098.1 hypothetical protein SAMN05421670_3023 [Psychrobacillus psychrotolerans]
MMKIIKGMFDTAKVFTENIDDVTMDQIKSFLDQKFVTGGHGFKKLQFLQEDQLLTLK